MFRLASASLQTRLDKKHSNSNLTSNQQLRVGDKHRLLLVLKGNQSSHSDCRDEPSEQ